MKIICPFYQAFIYIYIGVKYDFCVKDLKRQKITNDYILESGKDGLCLRLSNGSIVIWTRKRDMFVIAHECLHGAQHILERAGIYMSYETREVYAYYFEWLFKLCMGKRRL